ncbi:hypothetical protein F5X96DRAFT_664753 [Biscogniauxia mediterranea]|nr:hypothetical protein F5X96DRAFT_664753 [Biscogniauxia mediterranea]
MSPVATIPVAFQAAWENVDLGEKKLKISLDSCETVNEKPETTPGMWRGNLPCVHGPREGCCYHNPGKHLISYNKRLPSDKKLPGFFEAVFGSRKTDNSVVLAEQESEPIWCNLHIDHSTVDPLDPVHESIPYALAWYHINWVHSSESPLLMMSRVNALACSGRGAGRPDLKFTVEPFYYNNTFLLYQSIQFRLKMEKRDPVWRRECRSMGAFQGKKWQFQICPHMQHQFLEYDFEESRGLVQADVTYRISRSSADTDTTTTWKSIYGPSWLFWGCPECCTDSDVKIKLVEDVIIVSIRVYKNLGSGSSPFDKNWIAAIRPGYRVHRTATDLLKKQVVQLVQKAIEAKKAATLNRAS